MFGQDDFSSDFTAELTQSEPGDIAFVRRNDTGDNEYDFWANEPTSAIERITARGKLATPRKPRSRTPKTRLDLDLDRPASKSVRRTRPSLAEIGSRRHGNTQQIPVTRRRKAATQPFDADTGLGGQSPVATAGWLGSFGPEGNPLLRRVGAMVLLVALGVPVAMAMRGGDSDRTAFAFGAPAAMAAGAAAATSSTVAPAAVVAQAPAPAAVAPAAGEAQVALPAVAPVTAAAAVCAKTYTVVVGDGWLRIANKHQVAMAELLASNNATVATFLLVGSTICVPANAITPTTTATTVEAATPAATQPPAAAKAAPFSLPCAKKYTVVIGDGWLRIANKHSVAMKEVLAANAASVKTFLMVGRTICVPANATTPTTAKPTTTTVKPTPTTKAPRPAPTPTIYPPTRGYSAAEVEAIIREVWPDDLEEEALRIAKRESRLNPRAQNYCCYGLFQIYYNVHKKWLAEMGVTSGEQLLDPTIAAQAGLKLYQRNGWGPWKL